MSPGRCMDSWDLDVEAGMTITSGPPLDRPLGVHAGFVALYERELGKQIRRATLLVGSSEAAHDLVHDASWRCIAGGSRSAIPDRIPALRFSTDAGPHVVATRSAPDQYGQSSVRERV